jgi:hypothetical protein
VSQSRVFFIFIIIQQLISSKLSGAILVVYAHASANGGCNLIFSNIT